MKKEIMKCPNKINKTCTVTGYGCSHAIKHKQSRWCKMGDKICLDCVEVTRSQKGI